MENGQSNVNADRQIGISRLLNAPIEMVWDMWTKPEHIKHWWGPEGFTSSISKMEVKPNGEWEFIMHGPDGTDYKNKHIYREIIPYKKLVLEHVSAPNFIMEVLFEKQGNKTLLHIESSFESAEQLKHVIQVFKADTGMKQNVERLERYLSQTDEPFIIERIYNAPVEKVWAAVTDSEQMKKWYFDIPGFKPRVGHEFQFSGGPDDGPKYLHLCRVTEVVPYKKLSHTWRYDNYPGDSLVTWEFFEEGEKTRVKLTHSGLSSFGTHNPDFAKKNFAEGWTSIVGSLLPDFLR